MAAPRSFQAATSSRGHRRRASRPRCQMAASSTRSKRRPGRCCSFPESLLHSTTPIRSDTERVILVAGYTPPMLREWPGNEISPEFVATLPEQSTPPHLRQRQLALAAPEVGVPGEPMLILVPTAYEARFLCGERIHRAARRTRSGPLPRRRVRGRRRALRLWPGCCRRRRRLRTGQPPPDHCDCRTADCLGDPGWHCRHV